MQEASGRWRSNTNDTEEEEANRKFISVVFSQQPDGTLADRFGTEPSSETQDGRPNLLASI